MRVIIETERLRLREFTYEDTAFLIELLNSPDWIKFIGNRNVATEAQAIQYLEDGPLKSYRLHGFGLSLVEKKDDRKPIGMCGIIRRDFLENPDLGFAFLPAFYGKGYAFEIASATLNYAKHKLGLLKISAITLPENSRSIRLLEKIGLRFMITFSLPNSKETLLLYSN